MTAASLVARERSRAVRVLAASGGAAAVAAIALLAAGAVLALGGARWIAHPGAVLATWAVALVLAAAIAWGTLRVIRRRASLQWLACTIELEHALRSGALRVALEVSGTGALGQLAADRTARLLPRDLAPEFHRRARRRALALAGASGLAVVAAMAAARQAPDGWRAVLHPLGAWRGTLLPRPVLLDPPRQVLRGESVRLRIAAPGRRRIVLATRALGAAWSAETLSVRGDVAETTVGPLDADLLAVASDGRATSDTARLRVTDRPFVGDVALRAEFPAYLERPPVALPVGEPALVPRGTVLRITGRATATLARVALVGERDTVGLVAEGLRFGGRLTAQASARWRWMAATATGPVVDVPPPLEVAVIPDSAPNVEILAPARDTIVLADAVVPIAGAASDDNALGTVTLRSWRRTAAGQDLPATEEVLPGVAGPRWAASMSFPLAPRDLAAGDELHVVLVATDRSPWRQRATSRELVLTVPSLSAQRERARALGDSTAVRAAAAAAAQRELAERTDEAARSRGDRGEGGAGGQGGAAPPDAAPEEERTVRFQSAEQARALAESQQQLAAQVRALQRDAREMERQLRAAGALDSALQKRLAEAQELLAQALTPDLQRRLDRLARAAQGLNQEQVQRSLQDLARAQQRLREQLEQSAQMLQRAALEGAMQTLADEARDVAAAQRAVSDSLAAAAATPGAPADAAGERAPELADRARAVADQSAELARRLREKSADAGPQRLDEASRQARESATAMRRAARDSTESPASTAPAATRPARAEAARKGAAAMQRAAQQLAGAREAQIGEWKQQLTTELDRAIGETQQLARTQQEIARRTRAGAPRDSLQGEQSAVQQGAERVAQRLQSAARTSANVSPRSQGAMGEARSAVQQATAQLAAGGARSGAEAAERMTAAAQSLARAAAQMTSDRASAAASGSASGLPELLQRMQEAARAQGTLNGQTAGLLPLPGMQPGAAAQAQARSLAERQRALAERLGGRGADGRASALAAEMRQIASALENGRVNQQVIARQQQIFRRLLDAGLSLEQDSREKSGPRESRSADPDNSLAVTNTDATGAAAVRYRLPTWSELRGLSPEERRAVLEYFQRINASARADSPAGEKPPPPSDGDVPQP